MSSRLARLASGPAARLLREHVRDQLPWLLLATLCMAVYAAATAAQAWLLEPILDRVFLERDRQMLVLLPLAVVGIAVLKAGAGYSQTAAMARAGQRVVADLQRRLFDHVVRADVGDVITCGPGPLISRLVYDTQLLRAAVSSSLTTMARDLLTVLFLIGLMFWRDWQLATLALIGLPLATLPISCVSARTRAVAARSQGEMARLAARAEQAWRGIRQVRADGREADESARVAAMIAQIFRLQYRAVRIGGISSPVMEVIGGLALAAVIAYGGWQVVDDTSSPGMFFSFVAALLFAYQPLKNLAKLHTQVQEGLAAAERFYAVLDRAPRITDRPGAPDLEVVAGEIRFHRVSFRYRADRQALQGLDLVIPAGRSVALVGPSGAGKSTMLNLLLRFWDVDAGAVLIDGQDLRAVRLASLRRAIALVSQDVDLFDDTVAANIAYGRPDAGRDAIVRAAVAASAHEFIQALPAGYDTPIGPGGASLSGGERQRIGIARAMLKDAPILLLDEATSAVDADAERAIRDALRRLMRGRTTLVVAHRLSTVIDADVIAVVEQGRVVETGSHPVLLARGGRYASLYRQQFADQARAPLPERDGASVA
ncbi:MAG TPA: ABC transporter ATP-binding protein [Geminicoccaceae bacterium]|nr:ABC transporter ATP-binding protein [Geminicoccaceae bacterium]